MKKIVRTFLKNEKNEFLLVKHIWKDYWSLPWGHLEDWESIYKWIKRECKEELNLKIKILWAKMWLQIEHVKELPQPICTYKIKYNEFKGKEIKKLEYIFLSEIKSGEIKIQKSEISKYKFFSKEEILKLENTHIQVKEIAKNIDLWKI